MHNTKQNDRVLFNSYLSKGYYLRQFSPLTTQIKHIEKIDLTEETIADRTVIDCKLFHDY